VIAAITTSSVSSIMSSMSVVERSAAIRMVVSRISRSRAWPQS